MKLNKYILKNLKKFKSIKFKKEKIQSNDIFIKKVVLYLNSKKIKGLPLSFGFNRYNSLEEKIKVIENLTEEILLKSDNLKNRVLYVKNIDKHAHIKYLFPLEPKAVLINKKFGRIVYNSKFPILHIPSFLKDGDNIKLEFKFEQKNRKSELVYGDIGMGGKFIVILFPYDSRFQNVEKLDFWGSFQLFQTLIKRFENLSSDIYRIRFIAVDFKYSNYRHFIEHISKFKKVVAVYNIENSGLGNEKLIIKTQRYIIDRKHLTNIEKIFRTKNLMLLKDYSSEFIIFPIRKPIIWFKSQPNENIYKLDKEFLSDKLVLNMSTKLFDVIQNSYEGIKIGA